MSGSAHCCLSSRKLTPEPALNKKGQDCSVFLCRLTNRLPDMFQTGNDFPEKIMSVCFELSCAMLSEIYFIVLSYFPHKTCLLAMSQDCASKKSVQCSPWGFRQQCAGKNPSQCYLNTLETTLHRQKLYVPDNIAQEKIMCNVVLTTLISATL